MPQVLDTQPLKRKFIFKQKGKDVELDDFNPNASPEEIVKFYSGQYPELTSASVDQPKYVGNNTVFNITTSPGTLG
jgi:PRTRC genetic system protein C